MSECPRFRVGITPQSPWRDPQPGRRTLDSSAGLTGKAHSFFRKRSENTTAGNRALQDWNASEGERGRGGGCLELGIRL